MKNQEIIQRFFTEQDENNLTWGEKKIDEKFRKPKEKDYIYILGKPGSGKTTYCVYMAIQNALKGTKVLYLSLEMSKIDLIESYIENSCGITEKQREKCDYNDAQKRIIESKAREIENIHILDTEDISDTTVDTVLELAMDYDMIFLDNFGFLTTNEEEASEQMFISREILNFINKKNKCFVMLHHFAKGQNGKDGAEGRGSQKLVDDSFRWITLDRDKEENKLSFIMQKNRTGRGILGKVDLSFKGGNFIQHIEEGLLTI